MTIWEAFRTRQPEIGQDWQERITPAARLIAGEHGIPALKYAMDLKGHYGGLPRLPFVPPSGEVKAEIEEVFGDLRG